MNISAKIKLLKPHKTILNDSLMGIEKEGLRVSKKGSISQEMHPEALGCALTHPNITTDFSESLIELVTPPFKKADEALDFLKNTQHYLYHHLPKDQSLWPASMPCVIRGETYIPIAKYGPSNLGKMKTVYRYGLANRYGSVMQTIAGIHFNYSFSDNFWQKYHKLLKSDLALKDFIDDNYMALTRNIVRYGWIISYLFGTSPAVCKSFLNGYHKHSLVEFNESTLFEPYATSLRMGDIGYQNSQEDKAGVKANYNSLKHYIHSLKDGMQTSCAKYENIGLKKHGKHQQLNTNILQIENEYYSSVRPKPLMQIDEKPLDLLNNNGISYIELRSIDINPLLPLGINKEQINFLEAFMLFCLLEKSDIISTVEQFEIDNNDQLVAHQGRKPGLKLTNKSNKVSLKKLGMDIVDKISLCAQLLEKQHQQAVIKIGKRFKNPELTPSAISLFDMKKNDLSFFDYNNSFARRHQKQFLGLNIDKKHFAYLDKQARLSCLKQKQIEQADNIDFDEFLANYFN